MPQSVNIHFSTSGKQSSVVAKGTADLWLRRLCSSPALFPSQRLIAASIAVSDLAYSVEL